MILVQITDLHCRPRGMAAMRVCETNMLAERALRAVAAFRPRPDALVITGDLAANGLDTEYQELAAMLRRTLPDLPVYVIPGNHDRREGMRAELGHLPGVTDHPDFVQFTVEDLPVRLVMLDTLVDRAPHGELCAARMAWLDATLAQAPRRPTLIALHHPPFACGLQHMDAINLRNSAEFAALVGRHPQVRRIICGHFHRPVTIPIGQAIASIAPSVAHQVQLELFRDIEDQWNLEPAAFQVHAWMEQAQAIVSHTAYVERYPGPYPFFSDPV
jgi:3',5'-cyclic-AMP phosphodiesterase